MHRMGLALCLVLAAAALAGEPVMEKRVLMGADSAKRWAVAESSLAASEARMRDGRATLRWHIPVDHFAGEVKYPIGWPRIGYTLREPAMRDWSGWDYLEFWVHTDTSRAALPREPVGMSLHTPDREGAFHRPLAELAKGRWVRVRIPLTAVPRHHDVRLVQLHISESKYQHGDTLDLHIDEIALLRYARPTLLAFAAEEAVAFADAQHLAARFNLAGVKVDEEAEVVCELRQGGKVLAQTAAKLPRGPQRMVMDLARAKLAPGEYELVARVAGGETAAARVRLVESPWVDGKEKP